MSHFDHDQMPDHSRALIVLPTYNEAANIADLVAGLRRATRDVGPFDILVVDDGSPDGTAQIVRGLTKSDPHLHLLDRGKKLGLGTAYRAGFDHARTHGHEFVFTMDADFSHSPEHVPHLWHEAPKADLVIGSRYMPGGGIANWPRHRRMLSAAANLLARRMLRLHVRDCTSGFRCYRVALLARIDLDAIHSEGYSYLTEVLFRCQQAGARVREVPIKFVDRRAGKSKISKREIWKAMLTLLRLRFGAGRRAP
jgi:glycosyltransferase involved in cell wall biosynthesis